MSVTTKGPAPGATISATSVREKASGLKTATRSSSGVVKRPDRVLSAAMIASSTAFSISCAQLSLSACIWARLGPPPVTSQPCSKYFQAEISPDSRTSRTGAQKPG